MKTNRECEKEIDAIRARLYREMQELGREEYDRRKREQFLRLANEHGWELTPSPASSHPAA